MCNGQIERLVYRSSFSNDSFNAQVVSSLFCEHTRMEVLSHKTPFAMHHTYLVYH